MAKQRDSNPSLPEPLSEALTRAASLAAPSRGQLVVVYGVAAGSGYVAHQLAKFGPGSRIVVAATDLRQAKEAQAVRSVEFATTVNRLGDALDEPADTVLLAPSGYEGLERILTMIGEASAAVRPGGRVFLVAATSRGAKRLAAGLRAAGPVELLHRGRGGMRVYAVTRTTAAKFDAERSLDRFEQEILGRTYRFVSAPGVFSRGQVDVGTRLLLDAVAVFNESRILDLGCGYGPIGIVLAAEHPDAEVLLVDIDGPAVALAQANIEENGVTGNAEAIVSDGPPLGRVFDLVVSHFPLHIPQIQREKLVERVASALTRRGRLCVVVPAAFDLEPLLSSAFDGRVDRIADSLESSVAAERYVVLAASAPP